MRAGRFYTYFAAAYGTCWLIVLAVSFVTQHYLNLGNAGFFGFLVIGIIYANFRTIALHQLPGIYTHFAAGYGTCWLSVLIAAIVTMRNIDAGSFGLFGFLIIAAVYAAARIVQKKWYKWIIAGAVLLLPVAAWLYCETQLHTNPIAALTSPRFLKTTLFRDLGIVSAVAISPDGQTLVSGNDAEIKIWNLSLHERAAGASSGGTLSSATLNRSLVGHYGTIGSVAISPDGQTLVSGSGDGTIKIWDLKTGTLIRTLTGGGWVSSVAISPDGQTLVSGSLGKTIKIWHLKTGTLIHTLTGHSREVSSVAISSDGQTLASGSWDRTVKVWALKTGTLIRTLIGHSKEVRCVAISPDGKTLASGSTDTTVKIWDLRTGNLKHTLTGHAGPVSTIAISPDGQNLVSAGDDTTIKIWNLNTGNLSRTLAGAHDWFVSAVAISPDGQTLVSGGWTEWGSSFHGFVRIWRMPK